MNRIPTSILKKLEERREQDAFRTLTVADGKVDFFSNDYLGIARWISSEKHSQGSTGSRLISGNTKRTEEIERTLARFFGQEAGIMFNSGYDANLGLFSSVPQRGDTIIYDELIHASIRDGARMSNATDFAFKHNDIHELESKLNRATGTKYVAIESVYSMDGDTAPIFEISEVCEKHGAFLIVDEAHSGGVFGTSGKGMVSDLGLDEKLFAKVITFGKAFGSHGAIVLGESELRDYLINFARPLLYTTALPAHAFERIHSSVMEVAESDIEREDLISNINYFKEMMHDSNLKIIESDSPIQSIIIPGNSEAKALSNKLMKNNFAVKAILHPTVPKGKERLRICLHSYNTKEEIKRLTEVLNG